MLENYLPILIFMVIGVLVGLVALAAGFVLGPQRPDKAEGLAVRMRLRGIRGRAHEV